jgi:cysteine desulfurase
MISVSAHKFHGPKGIGLLIANKRTQDKLLPIIHGGNHERGLRSGTLNVPGIIGLTEALRIQNECKVSVETLRVEFEKNLIKKLPEEAKYSINGMRPTSPIFQKKYGLLEDELAGHPGNISITFEDIQATSIIAGVPDLAIATGSACTSATSSPSHVLQETGLSLEQAQSTIRISLSRFTTDEQINTATDMIAVAVIDYLERV